MIESLTEKVIKNFFPELWAKKPRFCCMSIVAILLYVAACGKWSDFITDLNVAMIIIYVLLFIALASVVINFYYADGSKELKQKVKELAPHITQRDIDESVQKLERPYGIDLELEQTFRQRSRFADIYRCGSLKDFFIAIAIVTYGRGKTDKEIKERIEMTRSLISRNTPSFVDKGLDDLLTELSTCGLLIGVNEKWQLTELGEAVYKNIRPIEPVEE